MAPKKRNFYTPRNTKNTQVSKSDDKNIAESSSEVNNKSVVVNSNLCVKSDFIQNDKYSKRTLESNWLKYEEPPSDRHAESVRGKDFDVLLSYSGGSGSQLKLQDEKEWEGELSKDISLDIQDLIHAMKCIPFHERIGLKNIFDETVIQNFISVAKSHEMSYKAQSKPNASEYNDSKETSTNLAAMNLIEEPGLLESDDDEVPIKNISVQDKTEDIINSLASNLSFKTFSEKDTDIEKMDKPTVPEEKKSETASNDLDFLLSLNISSNISVKQESSTPKNNTNVDDWLSSILDD